MEFTLPIYQSFHHGVLSKDVSIKTPQNMKPNLKCAFLFEKRCSVEKDALFAVKQDPAVLEAQVTVQTRKETGQESSTVSGVTDNRSKNQAISRIHGDARVQSGGSFEAMLSMQRAALQSLSSQQFDLLLKYVETLRKQRNYIQKQMECGFCKNNGHAVAWYSTHSLKDRKGRVRCPILRVFCCRRCGATGDYAHTIKYCPERD